ncbi:MAG: hypothetical protein J5554_10495 [Paludibacteraceae bacterium]|nr:hypothetical protein [Paludibacteraceae bacterium]
MQSMGNLDKNEVDLLDLLRIGINYMISFLKLLMRLGAWVLRFIYKQKLIIGLFMLLGLGYALFESRKGNLKHKASVEMTINMHDAYFFNSLLKTLDMYCQNEDKTLIGQSLNLTGEEAKDLLSIKSYYIIDEMVDGTPDKIDYENRYDAMDTTCTRMKDRLIIEVVVKENLPLFDKMPDALLYYFSNNSILKAENEMRMKQIDENIASINNEIVMLDSLRKLEYFKQPKSSQYAADKTVILNEKEKKLYHDDMLKLESRIYDLQWMKEINNRCVNFVSEFSLQPKAENRVTKSILKYVSLSFLLGLIVSFILFSRKDVKDFLENKNGNR